MSDINYEIASNKEFTSYMRNARNSTTFPNTPYNTNFEKIITMSDLEKWDITKENESDVVEIVEGIDKSKWSNNAKEKINDIIPYAESSCLKLVANEGTRLDYNFTEPKDFSNSSLGIMMFIDSESIDEDMETTYNIEVRMSNKDSTGFFSFTLSALNAYDNGWYLFHLQPNTTMSWRPPSLSSINKISILSKTPTDKKSIIYMSSIIKVNNDIERGKILLDFDDNFLSHFEVAYKYMTGKYGYKGNLITNGSRISSIYMSEEQISRMQKDGWNVVNHGWEHINWRGKPYEIQKENLEKNIKWMADSGFWYGGQIYAATNYTLDYNMKDNLRGFKLIRAGYKRSIGAHLSLPLVLNPYSQPLVANEVDSTNINLEQWKSHLKDVQDNKTLAISVFHDIANDGNTSIEHFKSLIDEIQNYDIDVITYADLLMGNW